MFLLNIYLNGVLFKHCSLYKIVNIFIALLFKRGII